MVKTPTINQYLLNIIAKAQLAAADKTKDARTISQARFKFLDLAESEVTFGPYTRDAATGKYSVAVNCPSRKWNARFAFNTGTLEGLSKEKQQGGASLGALDLATTPCLLYIDANKQRYLVIEENTNAFEAIKLTGYEFPADSFVPTMYGQPNESNRAVGHIDIDHPVVAGRYLLAYTFKPKSQQQKGDVMKSDDMQQQAEANSNEGDQAQPGSTQTEIKSPAQPGNSEGTGSNSTDATVNPADQAEANLETAKQNEADYNAQAAAEKEAADNAEPSQDNVESTDKAISTSKKK